MKLLTGLLGILMFLSSCDQQEAKKFDTLVFVKFSADNTTSFKVSSTDTLFREIKSTVSTACSFKVMSKTERHQLNELVDSLKNFGQPEHSLGIGLNQSVLFLKSDTANTFYTSQIATNTSNFRQLSSWFEHYLRDTSFEKTTIPFWDIDGIIEPPGPPIPVDSMKVMLPLTSVLQYGG